MTIKAVLFDFGDTLVSYVLEHRDSQIEFLRSFFRDELGRFGNDHGVSASLEQLASALNREEPDGRVVPFRERISQPRILGHAAVGLEREIEQRICDGVFSTARKYDDVDDVVNDLRSRDLKVGIVSNLPWGTDPSVWHPEFARHGFGLGRVDTIVCCGDVGHRKPNPAALHAATRALGLECSEVVFVGNSIASDVLAAKNANIRPILIDRHDRDQELEGVRVIKTLKEVVDLVC